MIPHPLFAGAQRTANAATGNDCRWDLALLVKYDIGALGQVVSDGFSFQNLVGM